MNLRATAAGSAHEPTLHCPNCNHEIKLTESLAAPLLEETRQRFQEQLASKDAEVAKKTEALRKEQEAVAQAREQIEDQVTQRLTAPRLPDADRRLLPNGRSRDLPVPVQGASAHARVSDHAGLSRRSR